MCQVQQLPRKLPILLQNLWKTVSLSPWVADVPGISRPHSCRRWQKIFRGLQFQFIDILYVTKGENIIWTEHNHVIRPPSAWSKFTQSVWSCIYPNTCCCLHKTFHILHVLLNPYYRTAFKILAPFGGQNGWNIKLLILWLKELFLGWNFLQIIYESVIKIAKFALLYLYMLAYGKISPYPKKL